MYKLRNEINSPVAVLKLCLHVLIPVALIIFVSDDTGMATVYIFIFLIMAFCAGVKLRYFLGAGALACISAPLIWNFVLKEYQKLRILVVFNPELDPLGKGYHAIQSKIALGAGPSAAACLGALRRTPVIAGKAYRLYFRGRGRGARTCRLSRDNRDTYRYNRALSCNRLALKQLAEPSCLHRGRGYAHISDL